MVRFTTDLGIEHLTLDYSYVWNAERVFGLNGPNPQSNSHLVNAAYVFAHEFAATAFTYLLDFEDDEPLNSGNTYGVQRTGTLSEDAADEDDVSFAYELTYARQTDVGQNPVDFDANFLAAQATHSRKGCGSAVLGYQLLGSNDGACGFRFSLGANH